MKATEKRLKEIASEIGLKSGDEMERGMIFLASLSVGANLKAIRQILPTVSHSNCSKVSWILRACGIWRAGRVYVEEKDDLHLNIILPTMCAAGIIEGSYKNKEKWLKWGPCFRAMREETPGPAEE